MDTMPGQHASTRSPESPNQELERLQALVVEQAVLIKQLRERIQTLEARLAHRIATTPASRRNHLTALRQHLGGELGAAAPVRTGSRQGSA